MAIDITQVYRRHPEGLGEHVRTMLASGTHPFMFDEVHLTRTAEESKRINNVQRAVILAGSGMCTGGRVLHHLRYNLWREESSVVLVGYQAQGTLGRALVDGAERVHIYGEEIAVKAKVHTINGFSAHADQAGLLQWLQPCREGQALLVHGENHALAALRAAAREKLRIEAQIARFGVPVTL